MCVIAKRDVHLNRIASSHTSAPNHASNTGRSCLLDVDVGLIAIGDHLVLHKINVNLGGVLGYYEKRRFFIKAN